MTVERFEKGIGMPIEDFIKIITEGFYYISTHKRKDKNGEYKEIYYQSNAIYVGNGFCPHSNDMVVTHPYNEYDDAEETLKEIHYWGWKKKEDVFNFQDYGKTWSAHREQLEKIIKG